MIYFQGDDFKAKKWCSFFEEDKTYFKSLKDMMSVVRRVKKSDKIFFRYQNNPKSFVSSLIILIVLILIVLKSRYVKADVYWICHNVDQDTSPYHKGIEKLRRTLLKYTAKHIFVLHHTFIKYIGRPNVTAITFGEKTGGSFSTENLALIADHSKNFDKLVLIAGQDGNKYKHFDRVQEIYETFNSVGVRIGFVLIGANPSRVFPPKLKTNILLITEKYISEARVNPYIDFIYRENNDISIAYTIYAAASASIPVIVNENNCLYEIVKENGIGQSLNDVKLNLNHEFYKFDEFLVKNNWKSLYNYFYK